jgi:hypothetical protein
MDAAETGLKPYFTALLAVLLLEAAAVIVPAGPLIATGLIRVLDILVVAFLMVFLCGGLSPIGLEREMLRRGLRAGILWSAGFGAIAFAGMGLLYLFGYPPFAMIRVPLPDSAGALALFFLIGGLVGPAAEEVVYRGIVYSALRRWGVLPALLGSTALFAFSHTQGAGLPIIQTVGGIVFCLSYERSKSLVAPIMIHVFGNTALFAISLLA